MRSICSNWVLEGCKDNLIDVEDRQSRMRTIDMGSSLLFATYLLCELGHSFVSGLTTFSS